MQKWKSKWMCVFATLTKTSRSSVNNDFIAQGKGRFNAMLLRSHGPGGQSDAGGVNKWCNTADSCLFPVFLPTVMFSQSWPKAYFKPRVPKSNPTLTK